MAWAFVAKTEPSLKARAMRFLARREHSREELRRKLVPKATEGDDVEAVLDDLAKRGWLSDARFAEVAIRSKARRFGPLKLANTLRAKGVDEEAIAAAFRAAGADGVSSLEGVWGSRFRCAPASDKEWARQVRFLQGRGFPLDDVFRFLKNMEKNT